MNEQLWWHVARSGGIIAWLLLVLSAAWGLALSTKLLGRTPTPAWLLSTHRSLGGLAVVFTGVHVAGLVADSYVHFGVTDLLVPMASSWRPGAVALGVAAMYLLLAVEITSLLMRRLPRKLWRCVHLTTPVLLVIASFHGAAAGSDAQSVPYRAASLALLTATFFLGAVRALAPRSTRRRAMGASP